ncbi:MAG: hypothetical protein AAF402_05810 [Pseudomonadota bacterium]
MNEKQTNSDGKVTSDRRSALKTALAGSAVAATVPAAWIKPTVSSVVLPGHASTTDSGGDPGAGTTAAPVCDPTILDGVQEARMVYYEGEGGYLNIEGLFVQPQSISIMDGTGALASSEFSYIGAESESSEGEGVFAEFEVGDGPFPANANLALNFDGQSAPCTLSAEVAVYEE